MQEALTKEQYDRIMANRDRPLTQDPIKKHTPGQAPEIAGGHRIITPKDNK